LELLDGFLVSMPAVLSTPALYRKRANRFDYPDISCALKAGWRAMRSSFASTAGLTIRKTEKAT
jgi:hypothetical protein